MAPDSVQIALKSLASKLKKVLLIFVVQHRDWHVIVVQIKGLYEITVLVSAGIVRRFVGIIRRRRRRRRRGGTPGIASGKERGKGRRKGRSGTKGKGRSSCRDASTTEDNGQGHRHSQRPARDRHSQELKKFDDCVWLFLVLLEAAAAALATCHFLRAWFFGLIV